MAGNDHLYFRDMTGQDADLSRISPGSSYKPDWKKNIAAVATIAHDGTNFVQVIDTAERKVMAQLNHKIPSQASQ